MLKVDGKTSPSSALLKTVEEAKAWRRQGTSTQAHPCGTCAMMPRQLGGVVNDRLIVYGTKNLRVVDARIFPMIPKGPITSSVYAIAERAVDIIMEDLGIS
jgi:choline dehydrogenase-like flavoprotein